MVSRCGVKLGAVASRWARPGGPRWRRKPAEGALPCFSAEGGRRARWAEWVKGQMGRLAGWAEI
jgi:hypothetical protein